MAVDNIVGYQNWAMRITLTTTSIVVLLSWLNQVRILEILVRGGTSFLVMYFLMAGIRSLFEKTASQEEVKPYSITDGGRGGVVDFSVGDDETSPQIQSSSFPGQVNPSLSAGLPGSKQQADIVRRMGWE